MKKRLSAILLACGLTASMLCGTVYAADSTEAAAAAEAATEAEEAESELAEAAGDGAETEAQILEPAEVEGPRKYESMYPNFQQSIEQTLAQLSAFTPEQIAQYLEQPDSASTRLVATWDQAREGCGEFEGIESYSIAEDGFEITFTETAKYKTAEEEGSKVTVQVVVDMKNQTSTYNWNVLEPKGKALAAAGINTIVGMVNVMLILVLLTLVIGLFRFIPTGEKKKQKELEAAKAAAPVAPAPVEEAPAEEVSNDDEIAAVIAAAVAAYESGTGKVPADGFVVRSIRRRGKRSNWLSA